MLKIAYRRNEDFEEERRGRNAKKSNPWDSPFQIIGMKPIQMPNLNVADMIASRKNFTTEEWITLLLRSTGIESTKMNDKERFHYLERLVPLVERNYNLCELGPRGTGKSHLYKEISPYSILMSGGQTTTANLFFNLRSRSVGLVGNWDCVAFDEVAGMNFHDKDAIQIMKDYMASGSFARGKDQINADGSIVFVGNTNDTPGAGVGYIEHIAQRELPRVIAQQGDALGTAPYIAVHGAVPQIVLGASSGVGPLGMNRQLVAVLVFVQSGRRGQIGSPTAIVAGNLPRCVLRQLYVG